MRVVALLLPLLLLSCSLLLQGDDTHIDNVYPTGENLMSISVSKEHYDLLLSDDYSTEEFPVRIGYDVTNFSSGKIRLRGQTTLDHHPRSFALDLRQDTTILLDSIALWQVSLIPFRSDTNFVYSLLGFYFAKECAVFAPQITLTTVSLNDTSLGSYLLVERSTDAMVRVDTTTEFVMRRRYGAFYDLKYYEPKDTFSQLTHSDYAQSYETLHTLNQLYSGPELIKELEERMNLRAYLQALALNTILANGDFHDEMFYAAKAKRDKDGINRPYFTFSIWDLSELFKEPHLGHFTPGSLIYSNENRFDRMIEGTPYLYKHYCGELQSLLDTLITDEQIENARAYMIGFMNKGLQDNEIRFADSTYSQEEILTLFDETILLLRNRKASIEEQLRLRK